MVEAVIITRKGVRQIARYQADQQSAVALNIADTANVTFNANRSVAFVDCTIEVQLKDYQLQPEVDRE